MLSGASAKLDETLKLVKLIQKDRLGQLLEVAMHQRAAMAVKEGLLTVCVTFVLAQIVGPISKLRSQKQARLYVWDVSLGSPFPVV